jgi:hypothetical protein
MKVAICLSGQPRDISNTLDNIRDTWSGYDQLDFFIHTWKGEKNKIYRPDTPMDICNNDINLIIDKLNPKSILVEEQKIFEKRYLDSQNWSCYHPTKNPNPSQNIQSMFYSINKSNLLKKYYEIDNGFTYDCVIRCRFDYLFTKKYDLSKFDMNVLNTKSDCKHTSYAINDHLALGNSQIMDVYSSVFFNLEMYYNMGVQFNPEVILGYHIQSSGIQVSKTLGAEESFVSTRDERKKNINV